MQVLIVILVVAGTFGLCFLLDKGYTKLFRSKAQHMSGKAVRLTKGDYDQMKVYNDDPASVAESFRAAGATHLHVVDLDGARLGIPQNAQTIRSLTAAGVAIVMVSHDIGFCARHAHKCALFFDGNIVTQGSPRTFFSGNNFYTTSANRMARTFVPEAVTPEASFWGDADSFELEGAGALGAVWQPVSAGTPATAIAALRRLRNSRRFMLFVD